MTKPDILTIIWATFSVYAQALSPHIFSFLLRANLLLLCPIGAAYAGFSQGLRNQKAQIILMVLGLLIGLSLPLDRLLSPSPLRPWITILLVLGLWYLPIPFSFLAHPQVGVQIKVLKWTRIALVVLFIVNLFAWR